MSAPSTAEMAAALVKHDGARPADSELLAAMVLDRLIYHESGGATVLDPHGRPAFDSDGKPVAVADLIGRIRRDIPSFFEPVTKARAAETAPAGETVTARVMREARQGGKAGDDGVVNPWTKGPGFSVTQQVLMSARDPAMAAKMQTEAGAK